MSSNEERSAIVDTASRYGVKRVLLFGSCTDSKRPARDIDLGIEGIEPEKFFKFYGELIFKLSQPVDLIDLSNDTKFNRLVRREGIPIYG